MDQPATPSSLTRWTNTVQVGLFAVLLSLPMVDSFLHLDRTRPRDENRAKAAYPKAPAGFRDLQLYLAGLEVYFNDHFGYRNTLVKWDNKLRTRILKDTTSQKVLAGKQNWLFFRGDQMVEHYSGKIQFTPEQLRDWQMLLEKRRDWLARRGIPYAFIIAPDKQTVYPEYLPDWVTKMGRETKIDQFFAYMKEHSTVPVLDLRKPLLEAKKSHPVYLNSDTHWNSFGSFAAYQELIGKLSPLVPALKLKPAPFTDFTLTNPPQPGGDLVRILGASMAENNAYLLNAKPGLAQIVMNVPPPERVTDPAFSSNPSAKGSFLLFHDSFAGFWYPFLAYNFNKCTYLWQYDLDPAWIERDRPDIVVTEMLERFFNIRDPKEMMLKEGLD